MFPLLAVVSSAAVNMRVCVFFKKSVFSFLGPVPRSGISGSYGYSTLNFLRNCQTVFYHDYLILLSHQQRMRVLISPHPHQHLLFSTFVVIASPVCVK